MTVPVGGDKIYVGPSGFEFSGHTSVPDLIQFDAEEQAKVDAWLLSQVARTAAVVVSEGGSGNPYHCPAGTGLTSGRFTDEIGSSCNPMVNQLSSKGLESRMFQLQRALKADGLSDERRARLEEEIRLVEVEAARRSDPNQPEGMGISVEPNEVVSIGSRRPDTATAQRAGESGADPSLTTTLDEFPEEKLDEAVQRLGANIPGFSYDFELSPEENMEAAVSWISDNVVDAYSMAQGMGDEFVDNNRYWYLAAHNYANDLAREFDVPPAKVAAMMAALSPQASWATNITNARRMLSVLVEDPQIDANAAAIANGAMWFRGKLKREPLPFTEDGSFPVNALGERLAARNIEPVTEGMRLSEMTDLQAAHALYGLHAKPEGSEIQGPRYHNPAARQFDMSIDGDGNYTLFDDPNTEWSGTPSTSMLGAAVEVFRAEDIDDMARAMGGEHKVRSFARNILDPFTIEDTEVTIDSHHVGISFGIPVSGKTSVPYFNPDGTEFIGKKTGEQTDREIYKIATAGNSDTETGLRGAYPILAEGLRDATRRISESTGINYKPSEIQSITWAAWREAWPPRTRREGADRVIEVRRREDAGEITAEEADQAIEAIRQEELARIEGEE